jgi:hypothetical protein
MVALLTALLLASPPGGAPPTPPGTAVDGAAATPSPEPAAALARGDGAEHDPRAATASPIAREVPEPRSKLLGVQLGAGAPQGFTVSAVVRPLTWLHGSVGFAHNILGPGVQASVTAVPLHWGFSPTFTLEGGRFFETDVSGRFSGSFPKGLDPALQKFGYWFYSAQLGAEFGSQERFVFYVRGGLAWVRSGLGDVQSYHQGSATVDATNVRLYATTPTVNLGFLLYVW